MTLRQIGGELDHTKSSGIWDLEDQILIKNRAGNIVNYRPNATYSKFWTSLESQQKCLDVNIDGTKVYVAGVDTDKVYTFRLSNPYDLSTAGPDFDIYVPSSTYYSLFFGDSGSKLYLISDTVVTQYSLNTPYDATSITGSAKTFTYSSGISGFANAVLSHGGTRLFIGSSGVGIQRYTLSTAWDIETASEDSGQTFTFLSGYVKAFCFDAYGTNLYVANDVDADIKQYSLSVAYDLTTTTAATSYSTSTWGATSLCFNHDGTSLFFAGSATSPGTFFRLDLSTAYDLSTAAYGNSQNINWKWDYSSGSAIVSDAYALPDGSGMVCLLSSGTQAVVKIPFKANGMLYEGYYPVVTNPSAFEFSSDGTGLWVASGAAIYRYALSEGWDLSTVVSSQSTTLTLESAIHSLTVAVDESYVLVIGANNTIYQLQMGTPGDLSDPFIYPAYSHSNIDQPQGIGFSTDGTQMYHLDWNGNRIYQYELTTPWKIRTANYTGNSVGLATYNLSTRDFLFTQDGMSVILCGTGANTIQQMPLSTAWDLSTAQVNKGFNLNDSATYALCFSKDGERMYTAGQTSGTVAQYNLSTPYDVTTASYVGYITLSNANSSETLPAGVQMKPDGTRLIILGDGSNRFWQYTLETPWEISSAYQYRSQYISLGTSGYVGGLTFGDSGTKFYYTDGNNSVIYRRDLTTAFDISTASSHSAKSVSALGGTTPKDLYWKPDGTRLYVQSDSANNIVELRPDNPWEISSLQPVYKSVSLSLNSNVSDFCFNDTGTKIYTLDTGTNYVREYDLNTAWAPEDGITHVAVFYAGDYDANLEGVQWGDSGYSLYLTGYTGDKVYRLKASTPYSITGLTPEYRSASVAADSSQRGMTFSRDGMTLFLIGGSSDRVYQYNLSTAWDITTASYSNNYLYVGSQESNPEGVDISSDGLHLYIVGQTSDRVFQYDLTTANDITTASYANKNILISGQESTAHAVRISSDGTRMALVGTGSDAVRIYSLSTAWDISTASYTNTFSVSGESTPSGLAFAFGDGFTEGTRIYVQGYSSDLMRTFNLSTAWGGTVTQDTSAQINILPFASTSYECYVSNGGQYAYILDSTNKIWQFDLTTNHDLSTARVGYFQVSAQDGTPFTTRFSPDGTLMYVLGAAQSISNDRIFKYTLSTPWHIGTASYVSYFSTNETTSLGMCLVPDGSGYVATGASDDIAQMTPTTNWGTGISSTTVIDIYTVINDPRNVQFNNDGTKLFVASSTHLFTFEVDTAYNTQTMNRGYSPVTDTIPVGLHISDDGQYAVVGGSSADTFVRYTLRSPWNITDFAATQTSATQVETSMLGMTCKPDGSTIYALGTTLDTIRQFSTSDFSVSGITLTGDNAVYLDIGDARGCRFSDDGLKFFTASGSTVYEFKVDIAWDIASLFAPSAVQASTVDIYPRGLYINAEGTKAVHGGTGNNNIYLRSMPYPWNMASHTLSSTRSQEGGTISTFMNLDGTELIVASGTTDRTYHYDLSTPYVVNTGVTLRSSRHNFLVSFDAHRAVTFSDDGMTMYVVNSSGRVQQFPLETAFDPSSSYRAETTSFEGSGNHGLALNGDEDVLYIFGTYNNRVYAYTLGSGGKLCNSTYVTYGSISADTDITGIEVSPDGSKIFAIGYATDNIYQFTNGTPSSIGTLTQTAVIDISGITLDPWGLYFGDGGKKVYFGANDKNKIFSLKLGTAYDLSAEVPPYLDISSESNNPVSICIMPSGKSLLVYDAPNAIKQFSIADEISDSTYTDDFIYVGTIVGGLANPIAMKSSSDGYFIYVLGSEASNAEVKRYALMLF